MEVVVLLALIGLIPAAIAHRKGYDFFGYWVFGALLFIVALPVAILKEDRNSESYQLKTGQRRPCPHCSEPILATANVCRYCGRDAPRDPSLEIEPAGPDIDIIRLLYEFEELSTTQVADRLGINYRLAETSLRRMADRGLVKPKIIMIGSHDRVWRLVR